METQLTHGDCLEELPKLEPNSVDLVLCDLPYGTTHLEWDSVINFEVMWRELERVRRPNAPVMLFGIEPFSTYLRMSNIKNWHHDVYWRKSKPNNWLAISKRPGKTIEICSVFGFNSQSAYNHGVASAPVKKTSRAVKPGATNNIIHQDSGHERSERLKLRGGKKFPIDLIVFKSVSSLRVVHPTQKPVALLEYLLRIYSNPGDTVLDFTMGSGSTGVACVKTGRHFVGIEIDDNYFKIAKDRIENA